MAKRENYLPTASDFPAGAPLSVMEAVRDLYEACATRRVVWPLNACMSCCMDEHLAREMCDWSLRLLTQTHIYEYQDAAHEAQQDADEYLHFLPRVAELISHGDAELVRHSTEIALDRLGGFDHALLTADERAAIARWSLSLWRWWLDAGDEREHLPILNESADALLVMFGLAGLELEPYLRAWEVSSTPWAAAQFGVLFAELNRLGKALNAFADDKPVLEVTIRAWVHQSDIYLHFASIWEQMSDREVMKALGDSPYMQASVVEALGQRARQ